MEVITTIVSSKELLLGWTRTYVVAGQTLLGQSDRGIGNLAYVGCFEAARREIPAIRLGPTRLRYTSWRQGGVHRDGQASKRMWACHTPGPEAARATICAAPPPPGPFFI